MSTYSPAIQRLCGVAVALNRADRLWYKRVGRWHDGTSVERRFRALSVAMNRRIRVCPEVK